MLIEIFNLLVHSKKPAKLDSKQIDDMICHLITKEQEAIVVVL